MQSNRDIHEIDKRLTKLETHYEHFVRNSDDIKDTIERNAMSHTATQQQLQELKDIINQGKGAYRLLIFLAGGVGALLSSVASAFMGKG